MEMTDGIVAFLKNSGLNVESRDKVNPKLTTFRRNIYFPEFLFELGLTGHKEEKFLLKIEAQDQGVPYPVETRHVQRCGFFFSLPVPPDSVMLGMKLSALPRGRKAETSMTVCFLCSRPSHPTNFFHKEWE